MKNWTVGKRITAGFATVIAGVLLIGLYGLYQLAFVSRDAETIASDTLPCLDLVEHISQRSTANRALIYRHICSSEAADMEQIEAEIASNSAEVGESLAAYEKTIRGEADRAIFQQVTTAREVYRGKQKEILQRSRGATNNAAVYEFALKEFEPLSKAYTARLRELGDYEKKNGEASVDNIKKAISHTKVGFIAGIAALLVTAIALALGIIRSVNRALLQASKSLEEGSIQVSAAATHVSSTSQMLAEGASEQAASLEESSASLEEISSMTKRNAENAENGKVLGSKARQSAAQGLENVAEMGRTLTAIKSAVGEMQSAVTEMQSSSQEIAKIIKTIDEIAFQTNLLALNAAVEAARAGEAGMGFAVVADEVRALAQRSAQAARDTSEKIESAVKRSELGGVASSKVVKSLGEVEATSVNLEATFRGIAEQVKSLDEVVAEIAAASKEQNQGISEVAMAVGQMDKVTQSNAAGAEENASASEELNTQAKSLQDVVKQLKAVVEGGQPQAGSEDSAPVRPDRTFKAPKAAPKAKSSPANNPGPDNKDQALPGSGKTSGPKPALTAAAFHDF